MGRVGAVHSLVSQGFRLHRLRKEIPSRSPRRRIQYSRSENRMAAHTARTYVNCQRRQVRS